MRTAHAASLEHAGVRFPHSGASDLDPAGPSEVHGQAARRFFSSRSCAGCADSMIEPIVRISRDRFHPGKAEWGNVQGGTHAKVR
jgi:hypothetical protein